MWQVWLYCARPDGSRRFINYGLFTTETAEDAKECALDAWWDPRLEAAGCSPDVRVEPMTDGPPGWEWV